MGTIVQYGHVLVTLIYSLNIFILHRLRDKFLQLILISVDSASWELHQYSRRKFGPMKNSKVETRSRDSNSGPHDCKVDALPHDHEHHHTTDLKTKTKDVKFFLNVFSQYNCFSDRHDMTLTVNSNTNKQTNKQTILRLYQTKLHFTRNNLKHLQTTK